MLWPLATLATNAFLVVGSAVLGMVAILTAWLPPRGKWPYLCALLWSRSLLLTGGVRLEVEHEEELAGGCYVFVANHQSLFDIPVLLASFPVSTRLLAKRALFRIPIFGLALRITGFVPVDRSDRRRAGQAVGVAGRVLDAGHSVLVFPEQTRSSDGRILPFKRGGFLLALKEDVPLVPVGISGSRAIRGKGSLVVRPGRVRVRFGRAHRLARGTRVSREMVERLRREVARLASEELA